MVLTPPDMIAEQDSKGLWTRRQRVEAENGPVPYTQKWYSLYLRNRCLPPWFLSLEHQSLVCNDREAGLLGIPGAASSRPQLPPAEYLALRYPTPPLYLRPSTDGRSVLTYNFPETKNSRELRALARRFPAIIASRLLGQKQISVLGTGHVTLRLVTESETSDLDMRPASNWRQETKETFRASYRQDWVERAPIVTLPAIRQAEEENLRAFGAFPDLNQMPHGPGRFEWMDAIDEQVARALGYRTSEEMAEARQLGALDDMRDQDRPRTVWYPDPDNFQPQEQPAGDGHWEFFTTEGESSARAHAALDWGSGPMLPDTPNPTAQDIWSLRQRYRDLVARGVTDEDPTMGVELVWVPGAPAADGDDQTSQVDNDELKEGQDQQQS